MAERFTIGALARRAGVNVETVRYYQRRRLLAMPARPPGGVRRYAEDAVQRLVFIKRAQQLGFTLSEIGELFSLVGGGCSATCGLGERKLLDIERRIADLRSMREALARLVEGCRSVADPAQSCPMIDALASPGMLTP